MDVEEKIRKKENKRKNIKKYVFPTFFIIIILTIIIICMIIFIPNIREKNKETNDNSNYNAISKEQTETVESEKNEIHEKTEKQIIGINNGTDEVEYNNYIYTHVNGEQEGRVLKKSMIDNTEIPIITYKYSSAFSNSRIWIYKDIIYIVFNDALRSFSLDGKNEKKIIKGNGITSIFFNEDNMIYAEETSIKIANLQGKEIKSIKNKNDDAISAHILNTDDKYIYYYYEEYVDDTQVKIILYKMGKNNYKSTKICQEMLDIIIMNSSHGIYQLETYGNEIYYVIGIEMGGGPYFSGDVKHVNSNGKEKPKIIKHFEPYEDGLSEGVIPSLIINNGFLYFETKRIDLKTNKVMNDNFVEGDAIDDENYVYTASLSDGNEIALAKYKAGTDFEDMTKIFTKSIPKGAKAFTNQTKIRIKGDYIYFMIIYRDMDSGNWRGELIDNEVYKMKKDGSELEKIEE